MPGRPAFQKALDDLQDHLLEMSDLVGRSLESATRALVDRDVGAAREVIRGDERVNMLWSSLEQDVVQLIATQQPMAGDLREILAVAMIATDLERMGDHAKHIAKGAIELAEESELPALPALERLAERVVAMLGDAGAAFVARDPEAGRAVAARDEEVDLAYNRLHRSLIARMIESPRLIDPLQRLVSVAKRLERSGDHVTNICEQVVFLASGVLVELNP